MTRSLKHLDTSDLAEHSSKEMDSDRKYGQSCLAEQGLVKEQGRRRHPNTRMELSCVYETVTLPNLVVPVHSEM